MAETVTRNFRVRGQLKGLYTPVGGSPEAKYVANMKVELWHKRPLEVVFLGSGLTVDNGEFIIDFETESPNDMIVDGKIDEVFLKVFYREKLLIGDLAP